MGARLKKFFPAWQEISNNRWVLETIKLGLKLSFHSLPPSRFLVTGYHPLESGRTALLAEVKTLINKKVLIPVPPDEREQGFYSTLFLIKKPDGSYRTIINLKPLNRYIKCPSFKMETLKSTVNLLSQGCFMVSIDLKDAYYHIPMHQDYQKYLRVAVQIESQVVHLQYQALPFGINVAPRIFTKIISEMAAHVREESGIFVPYLDDFLLVGNSYPSVQVQLSRTLKILGRLGWQINAGKSSLVPSQVKQFLGIEINSVEQKYFLPQQKINAVSQLISTRLAEPKITIRKAMSLLGLLTATIPAVPWAQIRSRPLQLQILHTWDRKNCNLDQDFFLSDETRGSLQWWLIEGNLQVGVPWRKVGLKILTTDASQTGWGAHIGHHYFQGHWGPHMKSRSSNFRELAAILRGIQEARDLLTGFHVQIRSDNSTAVAYVNKQGGTRNRELMNLAFEIFTLAEENFLSLSAVFLTGRENRQADFLSRRTIHQGDWCLNKEVFQKIVGLWGSPQIDLFATRENRLVRKFCSLNPSDHPWAIDAFSIEWDWNLAYAFPPAPLIPKVLGKIREDRARVILVAPFWPKRTWFSLLRALSETDPWVLPSGNLLHQGPIPHPQVESLHLTAWMLNGESLGGEDSQTG